MAKPDIIVIGASAGGVEALKQLVGGLRSELAASVFVVLHIGNGIHGHSFLPGILSASGPLPVVAAKDGDEIRQGHIYIARPNRHLMVEFGRVRSVDGPKVNFTRPAINPLFRSAAVSYGARVIGVVLTGLLDDGTAGLAEVKRKGGVAIVQNPASALYPSMPENALRYVDADFVLDLPEIPAALMSLVEIDRAAREVVEPMIRTLIKLTCPECRGPEDAR